jgi:hypothetical protein
MVNHKQLRSTVEEEESPGGSCHQQLHSHDAYDAP